MYVGGPWDGRKWPRVTNKYKTMCEKLMEDARTEHWLRSNNVYDKWRAQADADAAKTHEDRPILRVPGVQGRYYFDRNRDLLVWQPAVRLC